MVRRKAAGVGKQLSLPTYQQLMSQGSSFRGSARKPHQLPLMTDYWHNMCWSKLTGALPRMAVLAPPERSSRRLTRLRRQLMWSPREIVNVPQPKGMRMFQGNYVGQQQQQQQVQLQQGYPPTWGRAQWQGPRCSHPSAATKCSPMKSSSWGDYQISAAMAQQHQNSASSLNIIECPGCHAEAPVCYFESEASRFAAAATRIEQQQKELHHKQLQLQKLQEFQLSPQPSHVNAPVGILKKPARPEGGQSLSTEFHSKTAKRVTIHAMDGMDAKHHDRVLAPEKHKPLAKPSGKRLISHQQKEPQRDHPQGNQRKHQPPHEQDPPTSVKLPQQQPSLCTFNFGKFVSNYIDSCDRSSVTEETDSDTGPFIFEPPKAVDKAIKPKKSPKVSSKAGSKQKSRSVDRSAASLNRESRRPPEWPKATPSLETSKRRGKRSSKKLADRHGAESSSSTSTSTLTTENSRDTPSTLDPCVENPKQSRLVPKTPHQSQTSIRPALEECPPGERHSSLDDRQGINDQASNRELTGSMGKKNRIRKVNINQLLQNQELHDGNVVWESLVQLVGQMCAEDEGGEEQHENETCEKQRMIAGYGSDQKKKRKQYSVYLMVNSDEDDEEYSPPNQDSESPDIMPGSHNQITYEVGIVPNQTLDESHNQNQQDDYANHCYRLFQEEQCKPHRPKRKRRSGSRIKELAYPYPIPPPGQVLRRPLHWPKPDMSKLQTRSQRPRSTSKPPAQKRRQRSISTVQAQHHSLRNWEKVPLATTSCMMYPMMNSTGRHHY